MEVFASEKQHVRQYSGSMYRERVLGKAIHSNTLLIVGILLEELQTGLRDKQHHGTRQFHPDYRIWCRSLPYRTRLAHSETKPTIDLNHTGVSPARKNAITNALIIATRYSAVVIINDVGDKPHSGTMKMYH